MSFYTGIVRLLRVAWIAGIFPILIAFIPSSRLRQRGKLMQSSSLKFTVPQRFFCHFYVVGVLWTTPLIVVTWFYAYRMAPYVSEPVVYSSVANYLTGGSYIFSLYTSQSTTTAHSLYTAAPSSLCCTFAPEVFKFATEWMEFIAEGKNQIAVTEFDASGFTNPLMRQTVRMDWGSSFRMGSVVMQSLQVLCLATPAVANLALAAAGTHRWYLRKFDNYPSSRSTIIPLVY